jgi:hypothetical protein
MAGIRVAALVPDLMAASRIESIVAGAGGTLIRVDTPDKLPAASEVDLLVVDWGDRDPVWSDAIRAWRNAGEGDLPRIVLFGPHTDLAAHAAARDTGLGPMRARSAFFLALPELLTTTKG